MPVEAGLPVAVTDAAGTVVEPRWLAAAEPVHRQLRPHLPSDYGAALRVVFDHGGRMVVVPAGDRVAGLAVWRVIADTASGLRVYVDDLVTDEAFRSRHVGHTLIDWLEHHARQIGAVALTLDSGTQRTRAHRFYFREGFVIPSFHFKKQLT